MNNREKEKEIGLESGSIQRKEEKKGVEILTFCSLFGIWFSEGLVGVNWNISHTVLQRIIEK